MKLADLKSFFHGVYPSTLYTCSLEGIPNVNYISQVYYVDQEHVAISAQFLNKTKKNLESNPLASVMVIHPIDTCHVELELLWEKSETSGDIFNYVNERIEAIHSEVGGELKWKLVSVEVFRVTKINVPPEYRLDLENKKNLEKFSLSNLQSAMMKVQTARDLEDLYDKMLEVLETSFGFTHSMLLIPENGTDRLVAINSRGYEDSGVGAEVLVGEGVIGRVAKSKRPMAFLGYKRELIYAKTSQLESSAGNDRENLFLKAIELPTLPEAWSQIAIPLVSRNELYGVLRVESLEKFDFKDSDEEFLMTFGSYMAVMMDNFHLQHDKEYTPARRSVEYKESPRDKKVHVAYYKEDECIFIDGEYLIRNIPAKLLWRILQMHQTKGQVEFSNRELRMDASLTLPDYKDNLETRIILLRKRLLKKCPVISIPSSERGKFKLILDAIVTLELIERS